MSIKLSQMLLDTSYIQEGQTPINEDISDVVDYVTDKAGDASDAVSGAINDASGVTDLQTANAELQRLASTGSPVSDAAISNLADKTGLSQAQITALAGAAGITLAAGVGYGAVKGGKALYKGGKAIAKDYDTNKYLKASTAVMREPDKEKKEDVFMKTMHPVTHAKDKAIGIGKSAIGRLGFGKNKKEEPKKPEKQK